MGFVDPLCAKLPVGKSAIVIPPTSFFFGVSLSWSVFGSAPWSRFVFDTRENDVVQGKRAADGIEKN